MWLLQQAVRHASGFRAYPLLLTNPVLICATRIDWGLRDGDTATCTLVAAGLPCIEVAKNTDTSLGLVGMKTLGYNTKPHHQGHVLSFLLDLCVVAPHMYSSPIPPS
ncbi:unnamed protein product, partial [Ectocarpus sp. 8 AP-2014]